VDEILPRPRGAGTIAAPWAFSNHRARPSPHDLRAVGVIVELAEASGIPFCFVVNGTTPRTTIAQDAVRALAQHERVDPITLHQRIDFAANKTDRRTVGELNPQSRSPKNWRIYVFT
jgi:hypothetical protein